jgi:hypothetical protein
VRFLESIKLSELIDEGAEVILGIRELLFVSLGHALVLVYYNGLQHIASFITTQKLHIISQ